MEDDGDNKDETKRRTRNLSEKKRRDLFNMLVNELSTMVTSNNRKMDKSTVLKSTITFLKNHNEVTVRSQAHNIQEDWKPPFLSNEEFTYLLIEALEGFVMVFSANGLVHYVSESITSVLEYNPADIVNKNIFDLLYEDDRPSLYNILQNPRTSSEQAGAKDNEIQFRCHLKRGTLDIRDETTYELIQFNGHFRKISSYTTGTNMEQADGNETFQQEHDSRLLFICTGRLHSPQLIRDVSLVDTNRNEFTSRHSLEWKFLFLDNHASPIIGYLPFEVLGTSGYDYYHFDDLEKLTSCHEALMEKGEDTSCYYRFLTKGQQWIWLQSRFYITYHQWNSKPEFVVCNHRVVSYADIAKGMKQENNDTNNTNEVDMKISEVKEPVVEEPTLSMSPTYIPEQNDTFGSTYHTLSQPASVKSASAGSTAGTVMTGATVATVGVSWPPVSRTLYNGSDTASVSGDSRSSQRNDPREMGQAVTYNGLSHGNTMMYPQASKFVEPTLVPQHGIGTQYLDPAPYVSAVGVRGVLPLTLSPLPVIVPQDEAQIQEQLQRKHQHLQQMILRQQEELRHVKEQLLLARLGILQPIVNVPNAYVDPEELPANQRLPTQIIYQRSAPAPITGYPQNPPHSTEPNQNMPQ